jgi:hypothetical protein
MPPMLHGLAARYWIGSYAAEGRFPIYLLVSWGPASDDPWLAGGDLSLRCAAGLLVTPDDSPGYVSRALGLNFHYGMTEGPSLLAGLHGRPNRWDFIPGSGLRFREPLDQPCR